MNQSPPPPGPAGPRPIARRRPTPGSVRRAQSPPPRRRRAGLDVPGPQRWRSRSRRRTALRISLLVVAVLSALGLAGVGVVYATYQSYRNQLPGAAQLSGMEPAQDSRVYDRAGNLIALFRGDQRHVRVPVDQVSRWARLATIDVEDKNFYTEASWDLPRIVKAGVDDLRHRGATQGASTITQQLAKISFLGTNGERTWERKAKQVLLGIEIENNFSKDQILEMYLNRIEYGNNSVGIGAAAETYFHKSAHDLDLAEASLLAGLPNSPFYLDPLRNTSAAVPINPASKDRQQVVLAAMVRNGDITQASAAAAAAEPLVVHRFTDSEPPRTAFTDYVRNWLQQHYGGSFLNPGGWRIETTLDPARQALAEKTVSTQVAADAPKFNEHDGALVSMDPQSGELLAMVGSANPADPDVGQINIAATQRQPGSTIKLFTYSAAILSRQFTMRTPVLDAPLAVRQGPGGPLYQPQNYDLRFHGNCELQVCLGNSYNIPAVKVEMKVGIPLITDLEVAAGLTSLNRPQNRPGPVDYAATLGAFHQGVSPVELADGVSTIASLGVQHPPAPVARIVVVSTNQVVYQHDPAKEGHRVMAPGAAFIVSEMTSNDHNRINEFGANSPLTLPDRRVSAKTGTTEDFVDNWTVGYTPNLVTVAWVGNADPSCLRDEDRGKLPRGVDPNQFFTPSELARYHLLPRSDSCGRLDGVRSGITGAAPIWNTFMKAALAGTPKTWYQKPPDVLQDGSGDDAFFYLPGTVTGAAAPGAPTGGCYYYGPTPDPANHCTYTGQQPPGGTGGAGGQGGQGGQGNQGGQGAPTARPPAPPGSPGAPPLPG